VTKVFPFIFIAIVLILIAVFAYYSHLQQKQRREDMGRLATQMAWQFDPSRNGSHDDRFSQFDDFTKGHSRYAYNTLRGAISIDGRRWPVVMGDYHYKITSGSGKNRSTKTYRFSYAILQAPFVGVPDLAIRREHLFDKVAGFMGFDDIDFESQEFSKRFHVSSSDKKFAYDVIHPRMMEFLLESDPPKIEVGRSCCLITDGRKCWELDDFQSKLKWAEQFFGNWPNHLVATLER